MGKTVFILMMVGWVGCNGGEGLVDGGEEKAGDGYGYGYDYDCGDDGGMGDEGGIVVDEDLGDDLGLLVSEGMCFCGVTGVCVDDFPRSFERKWRVCLRAGMHRLQKDMRSFELDLVESVEVGPEAVVGVPSGPGVGTLGPPGQPDGFYSFMFEQEFTAAGTPFVFSIHVSYPCANSEPVADVVTLDDAGLCDRQFFAYASWGGTPLYLGSCQYSLYYCGIVKFNLQGGGWLKVEECDRCQDWLCEALDTGVRRAEFSNGQGSVLQDDYFGLVVSWRHHNWGNDLLARFDRALGDVQGVYVGADQYPDCLNYSQATLLDANLDVLETRSVTGVECLDQW